jgi:hypothetical protein
MFKMTSSRHFAIAASKSETRPMADSNRTQIIIALITVMGALGGTAIANWDKLFGPKDTPVPIAAGSVSSTGETSQIPDRCIQGFVWRDAFDGDHVCVIQEVRDQTAYDNSQAEIRRDPNGASGPASCISGFVWREARIGDVVCVTPDRRTSTAEENSRAMEHRTR